MIAVVAVGGAVLAVVAYWLGSRRAATAPVSASKSPDAAPPDPMYQDVLDQHSVGVVVAGVDGTVEYRNTAAKALVGTHVGLLIDGSIARHLCAARAGSPSSETLELFGPPKRVVVVTGRMLASGRTVAFVDDVTDRTRADRARTDFVANVSHELRTPIGALMVLAETLVDADDPVVVRRVVGRMQGEAERASRTIDDLLELSQVEDGHERDFQPVRLVDVVCEAIGRAAELAERRHITISTTDPAEPTHPGAEAIVVDGDRRQLVSAVGNLVENAVKYSDAGDRVRVRVRRDGVWGEIVVTDEGAGIPHHHLDRIFERFYRVDGARSRSTGGTGLGLSIVRHVALNNHGEVTVDSPEGEGSTFVLRFPMIEAAEAADRTRQIERNDNEGVA